MSPFQAPERTRLQTDASGRASCMSLLFGLNEMTTSERIQHLEYHDLTCNDPPDLAEVCPICRRLRKLHRSLSRSPLTQPEPPEEALP
jgi:hypothetical protein